MWNCSIEPQKRGFAKTKGALYAWAVFNRKEAEDEVGWEADTGNTEFAERLMGRSNSEEYFEIRVFKNAVLVTCLVGLVNPSPSE